MTLQPNKKELDSLERLKKSFWKLNSGKYKNYLELGETDLFTLLGEYNFDDGFELPYFIASHPKCTLPLALNLFYLTDGITIFLNKEHFENSSQAEWTAFVKFIYNNILQNKYPYGTINFKIPLTKVTIYKIRKTLRDNPLFNEVFFTDVIH